MGLITGSFEGAKNAPQQRRAAAADPNAGLPLFMKYRWVFVLLFLFPMSVLFDVFWWLRKKLRQRTTAAERHEDEVGKVQKQIHDWRAAGATKRLCTTRPAWMAMSLKQNLYKNELCQIEVNMQSILEINQQAGTVRLEPFVTIGEITSKLVPLGWTLQVVPELDDLTVGGLIMGTGIESSSHKYGLFQDICESFELVDSHGDVVRCSRTERPELFHAVPWSYGTLGFLVAATLRMTRCKRYVRVEYLPCTTKEEFVRVFQEQSCKEHPHEFVEGLAYSPDTGVVMVGDYCDAPAPGEKVNNITLWYQPWFYQHVKGILLGKKKTVECIPLRPYYHRHTRGIFWQMEEILPFGNNPWFRFFFGWVYPIKVSMLKLTTPQHLHKFYESKFICQDMLVPIVNLAESLTCFNEHVGIYPLWLCPHRLYREEHQGMISPDKKLKPGEYAMFVDIGCYGFSPNETVRAPSAVRSIEKFVKAVGGFQMLYADTYLTREDFWGMFDGTLYNKMRKEMDAESGFPDVYDKVRKR